MHGCQVNVTGMIAHGPSWSSDNCPDGYSDGLTRSPNKRSRNDKCRAMRQRVGATATPFHPLGETVDAVGVPFDLLGETLDAVDIGREHLPDIDFSPMSTASKDSSSEPDGTQTASKVLPNGWNAAAGEHPTCCWDGAARGAARTCLLYTSPSPRDRQKSRMPSSA